MGAPLARRFAPRLSAALHTLTRSQHASRRDPGLQLPLSHREHGIRWQRLPRRSVTSPVPNPARLAVLLLLLVEVFLATGWAALASSSALRSLLLMRGYTSTALLHILQRERTMGPRQVPSRGLARREEKEGSHSRQLLNGSSGSLRCRMEI